MHSLVPAPILDLRPHRSDVPIFTPAADWLERHADVALRLLLAPPGFGKTSALDAYAARGTRRQLRLPIDEHLTSESFAAAIAPALAASAASDIVLDDLHRAGTDVLAAIGLLVDALPLHARLIAASQRSDIVDLGALFARGRLAVCDQTDLAFDRTAAGNYFAAAGVEASAALLDDIVGRAGGWPTAIAGTAREIARAPQTPASAYDRWQRAWSLPAADLMTELLERLELPARDAIRRHFVQGAPLDQTTLAAAHRCGFFVNCAGGTYSLMNWVDALWAAARPSAGRPTLDFELFGRFTASVAGVPIVWVRRRDAQIVKYLLLRPDGGATRSALADVFWPGTARPQAMQNLRTACSTIRRAIGNVVGIQNVDAYFVAGDRLAFNRAAIDCDAERFRRHVACADADEAAGRASEAVAHLRAAERLYGHGLFAGDVSEPAFFAEAEDLAALYARVLTRLSGLLIERGSLDLAREYAAKAHKLGLLPGAPRRPHVHLRVAAS